MNFNYSCIISASFIFFLFVGCITKDGMELSHQAKLALDEKDYDQAFNLAEKALNIFKSQADTTGQSEAFYLLARTSALSGNFDKAIDYGEQGSKLARLNSNYSLEYQLNNTLSWAYFSLGKSFDETRSHQERQLNLAEHLDDEAARAMVYNNYGYNATVSGAISLDKAIEYMRSANDYYARTENTNGRWYTLMNLTWQHRLKGELDLSEHYGILSVKQARSDSDRHAIIEAITQLGETLMLKDNLRDLGDLYEEALEWSQQDKDRDKYVFDIYYSRYLWKQSKRDEGIKRVKSAVEFFETGEIFYEMLARAYLAEYALIIQDYELARRQIAAFEKPRANYYSMESKVIAYITAVKLEAMEDPGKAKDLLKQLNEALKVFDAPILMDMVAHASYQIEQGKTK